MAVVNDLINPGGHSYAIIGGRRFGKSSFLEATQYLLANHLTQISEDAWCVFPILVNLKRLPVIFNEAGVFGFILNRLHRVFTSQRDQRKLDIDYLLDLGGTALRAFVQDRRSERTLDEFSDIVEEIIDLFEGVYGFLRLVLLIDEIETVMDQDWSDALFSHLRSLVYEGPLMQETRCVIAGASKVIDFREEGSPFLNMLNIEFLEALTEEESRSIIAWAGDIPEPVTTAVLQESGGHPFIIQFLMYHLVQGELASAIPELVTGMAHRFTADRHADLERWLHEIGHEGQDTYQVLMRSEDWLTTEQVRALVGRDVDQALNKLRYHGLIIHDGRWSRYRWTGRLFKDWFGLRYGNGDDEHIVPVKINVPDQSQHVKRVVAEPVRTILRLHISQHSAGKIEVRGLQVPGKGEPKAKIDLPFSLTDVLAILKALDLGTLELPEQFKTEYIRTLDTLGLLNDRRLKVGFRELIGHKLYNTLVAQELLPEYVSAERSSGSIALQLCFDPEEVTLAQLPWELIHDGNIHLVASKDGLEFTRYITFADPPTPLEVDLPLNLLFISPRPAGESWLPNNDERQAVLAGLDPLCQSGHITLRELQPPTWEALEASLDTEAFEIIHFYGHGSFARVCPGCGTPQQFSVCQKQRWDILPTTVIRINVMTT